MCLLTTIPVLESVLKLTEVESSSSLCGGGTHSGGITVVMPNLWVLCYLVGLTTLNQAVSFSLLCMEKVKHVIRSASKDEEKSRASVSLRRRSVHFLDVMLWLPAVES